MKPVIFGVLAFVIGLGGSTGVMVLTTPVRLTAADSLAIAKADSTRAKHPAEAAPVAHEAVREAAPAAAAHESSAVAPATPEATHAAAASTEGSPAPVVTHVPPAAAAVRDPRAPNLPDADSYKQVGSILLNMKPAEAAKIVSYLNDDQVEGLLRSMSPRQAAGVFGQLPPERAAALSRRLLIPAREDRP
jgi:hypothetical protein